MTKLRITFNATAMPSPRKKGLIGVPDFFFKNEEDYEFFWKCLNQHFGDLSRDDMADEVLNSLSAMDAMETRVGLYIPHLHRLIKDWRCRVLDQIREADKTGKKPRIRSTQMDLLRLLATVLQYERPDFYRYVQAWCEDEDLFLHEDEEHNED